MTPRAVLRRRNCLLLNDLLGKFHLLVFIGWYPVHIGQLYAGPQMHLRIAVALKAPAHTEGLDLHDNLHLGDIAVAISTADTGI